MNWVETTHDHLRSVIPQPLQTVSSDDLEGLCACTPEALARHARTGLVDGKPVAVLGATPFWPGVATLWALISESALSHGALLTRGALRYMVAISERDHFHRLQAFCRYEHVAAGGWLQRMGFEREGLMERVTPEATDMWLYARHL